MRVGYVMRKASGGSERNDGKISLVLVIGQSGACDIGSRMTDSTPPSSWIGPRMIHPVTREREWEGYSNAKCPPTPGACAMGFEE